MSNIKKSWGMIYMKKKLFLLVLVSLISIGTVSAMECGSTPTDGCVVTVNTTFNAGTYYLPNGIEINASNIVLDCNGATLEGSNIGHSKGVHINNNKNNIIKNCVIKKYYYGIRINASNNNTIINNTVHSSKGGAGISIGYSSDNNIIVHNNVYSNTGTGIGLYRNPQVNPIPPNHCIRNTISSNQVHNNGIGILISSYCYNNTISGNNVFSNDEYGIFVSWNRWNYIISNIVTDNKYGIYTWHSWGHIIKDNTMCGNTALDIYGYYGSHTGIGDNNRCDIAVNWNDTGTVGCTYPCCVDDDNDGVCNEDDNCPNVPNPEQEDCNNNGVGDACDEINPEATEIPGNEVDENCDSTILCNPYDEWKNHGKFVSCVSKEAEKLLDQGLITEEEKDEIVSTVAKSDIGKKK